MRAISRRMRSGRDGFVMRTRWLLLLWLVDCLNVLLMCARESASVVRAAPQSMHLP
jgi:hypothetical protein